MAISASTTFEVRTTGDDANGGGFVAGASGTDYSQQDAAQVTYTDLAIDAVSNTKVSSAAQPFTSAHVGNLLRISGGTGFTTGVYQVVSVASSVATLDRAVGTTSSTGGTGRLGGALATYQRAEDSVVAGNTIWLRAGTYAEQVSLTTSGTALAPIQVRGYGTTRGDGIKATLTGSNTRARVIDAGTSVGAHHTWMDLVLTGATSALMGTNSNMGGWTFIRCRLLGGLACKFAVVTSGFVGNTPWLVSCEVYQFTGVHSLADCSGAELDACEIHGNSGAGLSVANFLNCYVRDCLIYGNGGRGIDVANNCIGEIARNTVRGNGSDGVRLNGLSHGSFKLWGNLLVGNGGKGIAIANAPSGDTAIRAGSNVFYNNTSGEQDSARILYRLGGDVTLAADPFVSPSLPDLSTAPASPSALGAGWPSGATPSGGSINAIDAGALQAQAAASGGAGVGVGVAAHGASGVRIF